MGPTLPSSIRNSSVITPKAAEIFWICEETTDRTVANAVPYFLDVTLNFFPNKSNKTTNSQFVWHDYPHHCGGMDYTKNQLFEAVSLGLQSKKTSTPQE